MAASYATLATYLPSGALNLTDPNNIMLDWSKLSTSSAAASSYVPGAIILFEAICKMFADINTRNVTANPAATQLTFAQASDTSAITSTTTTDSTLITRSYTFSVNIDVSQVLAAVIDPTGTTVY